MSIHNNYEEPEINSNNIIINSIKNNISIDKNNISSEYDTIYEEVRCKSNDLKEEISYLERHCRQLQIEVAKKDKNIMLLQDKLVETLVPEDMMCSICMDTRKTHAFNLCGHLCVCKDCGNKCVKCPICRAEGILIKIIM